MPLIPNLLERFVFLTLNAGPAPAIDIFGAISFRAVLAAVRLGIFDALADGAKTIEEIARATNASEQGMVILLDALVTIGYLQRDGARYANTPMTRKWMTTQSEIRVTPAVRFFGTIITDLMKNLEDTIRTGKTTQNLYGWIEDKPEQSRDFQDWMVAAARIVNDEVLSKLRLSATARRVVDIGGGHGMYSIALCLKYPQLSAVIFDSPQALNSARANIAAAKLERRVSTQVGDFMKDDFGSGYDVALLFNIVHGLSVEQNRDLLRRVHASLNRGGVVAVVEQMATNVPSAAGRAINAMLHLSYFHLIGGGIYSFESIASWLKAAGFVNLRRSDFWKAPGSSLVTATKLNS